MKVKFNIFRFNPDDLPVSHYNNRVAGLFMSSTGVFGRFGERFQNPVPVRDRFCNFYILFFHRLR